jgi:hypothetical protein
MSSFKDRYPEFAAIEHHIRRANAERSVYIARVIAEGIASVFRHLRGLVSTSGERAADVRAIRSDPFLKRSVPKY